MAERQFRDAREKPIKRGCLAGDKQIGQLAGRVRLCDTESVVYIVCVRTVEREGHLLTWQRLPLTGLPSHDAGIGRRSWRTPRVKFYAFVELHVYGDLITVLQIPAHTGQVGDNVDPKGCQRARRPNSRELQHLLPI